MPSKRKAVSRLAAALKRRRTVHMFRRNKRRNVTRSRVFPNRNVHSFKRWAVSSTKLGGATAAGAGYAEAFTFNQLPSYSEFDVLYDRYMLTTVVFKVQLINNPDAGYYVANNTLANAANWYPKFWYVTDYDDDTTPTTLDELKQYAKTKHFVLQPNKEYKIVIKPAVNIQTYRTATTTGYAPKWKQWIDIAQTDVPHYGLKYWIDPNNIDANDAQQPSVRIERLFYFKCKDVR